MRCDTGIFKFLRHKYYLLLSSILSVSASTLQIAPKSDIKLVLYIINAKLTHCCENGGVWYGYDSYESQVINAIDYEKMNEN